jgi:hypothetical protein
MIVQPKRKHTNQVSSKEAVNGYIQDGTVMEYREGSHGDIDTLDKDICATEKESEKINDRKKILWALGVVRASAAMKAEWLQPTNEDAQKYIQS